MKSTLILIPSYEPDEHLLEVVKLLKDNDYPVLVVNDGSDPIYDDVFNKAKEYATCLSYKDNMGKGYALKYGFQFILDSKLPFDNVITVDGDGQHSIKDINRVYDKLCETGKIVIGTRLFDQDTPLKSKCGNEFSKFTRTWLTKQYLKDDQCGLRGFPVSYLPLLIKMRGHRYGYEMNQIVQLQMMHIDFVTISIETIYIKQNNGTHFLPFKDTVKIQTYIFINALPAILCNLILMTLAVLAMRFSTLPSFAVLSLTYLTTTSIYLLIINLIYKEENIAKCLVFEISAMIIKLLLSCLLIYLIVDLAAQNHFIFVPIVVFLLSFINVPLAYLFDRVLTKKS